MNDRWRTCSVAAGWRQRDLANGIRVCCVYPDRLIPYLSDVVKADVTFVVGYYELGLVQIKVACVGV